MLMQGIAYVLLRFFNGGQPGVEAGMIHLLIMVAMGRERHTSSLVATRNFFLVLLLVVVEVSVVPLLA